MGDSDDEYDRRRGKITTTFEYLTTYQRKREKRKTLTWETVMMNTIEEEAATNSGERGMTMTTEDLTGEVATTVVEVLTEEVGEIGKIGGNAITTLVEIVTWVEDQVHLQKEAGTTVMAMINLGGVVLRNLKILKYL